MSDRTAGSVRTESRGADTSAPQSPAAEEGSPQAASSSTTQAIPTTGSLRAQSGGATAQPAAGATAPAAAPGAAQAPPGPGGPAPAGPATDDAAAVPAPATAPATAAATGTGPAARRGPAKSGGRGPRRARLQLRHIDIWSAFKISLVLSIALFFIWMVAVGVLYGVLSGMGVFETLNDLFGQLGSASGSEVGGEVITPGVVFGGAAVIGAINVVLLTALCTVATFIYNLCSDLVGGLEVTLSERD